MPCIYVFSNTHPGTIKNTLVQIHTRFLPNIVKCKYVYSKSIFNLWLWFLFWPVDVLESGQTQLYVVLCHVPLVVHQGKRTVPTKQTHIHKSQNEHRLTILSHHQNLTCFHFSYHTQYIIMYWHVEIFLTTFWLFAVCNICC